MKTLFPTTLLALLFSLAANTPAMACAACWNPAGNEKMNNAAAIGIFAMVIIMFVMLGAVIAFGFHLRKMEKNPLPDYNEILSEVSSPDSQPPASKK